MSLLGFCQWLAETSVSVAIRDSAWAFPIIDSVHVLGLCLFGMAVLMDLRVLGAALTRVPAPEIAADLAPWMAAGVVVMIVSGILTFLNAPVEYYNNPVFRIKVIILLLVAVNAVVFRVGRFEQRRAAAFARSISLVLWAGVIVAGRMITYNLLGIE
jgi:NO-binding membrane sensor protein with MHYT domain